MTVDSPTGTRIERIAHRGANTEAPENSLPAFRIAFARGADAIELDVHGSADGVVVVHHDEVLHGGRDDGVPIATLPVERVTRHRIAPGVPVPTLDEVLSNVPRTARVYVEIKGAGIESRVADAIRRASVPCAVHAFDHAIVRRMREIAPEIPRGLLYDAPPRDLAGDIAAAGARDVWPEWSLVDRTLVDDTHAAGARIVAWTVDDAAVARTLIDIGVDALCGDEVRLFETLASRSG